MEKACGSHYTITPLKCDVKFAKDLINANKWTNQKTNFSMDASELGTGKYVIFEGKKAGTGDIDKLYCLLIEFKSTTHVITVKIAGSNFAGSYIRIASDLSEVATLGSVQHNSQLDKEKFINITIPVLNPNGSPYVGNRIYVMESNSSSQARHRCDLQIIGHDKKICMGITHSMTNQLLNYEFAFNNPVLSDVTFLFRANDREKKIHCHKIVLSRLDYFRKMFMGSTMDGANEIDFTEREQQEDGESYYEATIIVLYYVYTGCLPKDHEEKDVFTLVTKLAHEWMILPLLKECEKRFMLALSDRKNVVMFYCWAKLYDLVKLKACCLEVWKKNWETLINLNDIQLDSKTLSEDGKTDLITELMIEVSTKKPKRKEDSQRDASQSKDGNKRRVPSTQHTTVVSAS